MSDGAESKIAHDDESIYSPLWSPDGSQIAYIGGSKIIRHDESPSYSGEKLIYAVFEYAPGHSMLFRRPAAKPRRSTRRENITAWRGQTPRT